MSLRISLKIIEHACPAYRHWWKCPRVTFSVAKGQYKAVTDDIPVLVLGWEQVGYIVGDRNQIEKVTLGHLTS